VLTGGLLRPSARRHVPVALALLATGCAATGAAMTATIANDPIGPVAVTSAVGATGEPGSRPGSTGGWCTHGDDRAPR
jgi:hypothetical protein